MKINKGVRVAKHEINVAMSKMRDTGATWGQIGLRFKIDRSAACQRVLRLRKRNKYAAAFAQARENLRLETFLAKEKYVKAIELAKREVDAQEHSSNKL